MRLRIIFFTMFCLALVVSHQAQTRSVTNSSLAQYKESRLRADREYLENYERLEQPSPEEIDRRMEQRHDNMQEIATQLRAENLERDRLTAELVMNARTLAAQNRQMTNEQSPFYDGFVYGGGGFFYDEPYGGHRHRSHFRRQFNQSGYVGGGQFWPTGPRTPSRPMFSRRGGFSPILQFDTIRK